MNNFDFKRYFIRVAKYLVYLAVYLVLFLVIFSLISGSEFKYEALFRQDTKWQLIGFLLFFSFIYPFFGYITKKVFLSSTFENDKESIMRIMSENNFVQTSQFDNTLVFRHKSPFIRFLRMYEDQIVIEFSENPIAMSGQRRDVYRLARMIEYASRNNSQE